MTPTKRFIIGVEVAQTPEFGIPKNQNPSGKNTGIGVGGDLKLDWAFNHAKLVRKIINPGVLSPKGSRRRFRVAGTKL